MSTKLGAWTLLPIPHLHPYSSNVHNSITISPLFTFTKVYSGRSHTTRYRARRRVIYDDDEDDEEYGHNEEIAMLEKYSQSMGNEVLLVKAMVDGEEAEVLIFKGFSSCLSYKTSPDPSKSVLPSRAEIISIDRIRGPFDPSNIDYIEKGLSLEAFKNLIQQST